MILIFRKLGLSFQREKKFENCCNPNTGEYFRFDFYLREHNLVVEYDGKHHETDDYFKWSDGVKNDYLASRGIKLLRINRFSFSKAEKLILKNLEN